MINISKNCLYLFMNYHNFIGYICKYKSDFNFNFNSFKLRLYIYFKISNL